MGKFIIKRSKDGLYMYNLKSRNGEIILTDTGFSTREECVENIDKVRYNCSSDSNFVRLDNINEVTYNPAYGRYHFRLVDNNSNIIGHSELYEQAAGMINGIDAVKEEAPDSSIVDE